MTSGRLVSKPRVLLFVLALILLWSGCQSDDGTFPGGDAQDIVRQVAESPWGAVLETSRTLQQADDGWQLANRRDELFSGFAPAKSDAPIIISSAHGRVAIFAEGRRAVLGEVVENAVVYPGAARGADVLVALQKTRVEELLVLSSEHAQHELKYRLELGDGMTVEESGNGLAVLDDKGRFFTRLTPPMALDARGEAVAVELAWQAEASGASLVFTVDEADAYPLVVDPAWVYGLGSPRKRWWRSNVSTVAVAGSMAMSQLLMVLLTSTGMPVRS